MNLTLLDILTLAFGTGAVASFISWIKDSAVNRFKKKKLTDYTALRLAIILDEFAIKCASLVDDLDCRIEFSGGYGGDTARAIPTLTPFPSDIDWKTMPHEISSRILSLPNEILKNESIINEMRHLSQEEVSEVLAERSGYCGFIGWQLANDLRIAYHLPAHYNSPASWDITRPLKQYYELMLERKNIIEKSPHA